MNANISTAIVTYQPTQKVLERTLATLAKSVSLAQKTKVLASFKLFLFANDNNTQIINKSLNAVNFPLDMEIIASDRNHGFGAAHNRLIERSASDFHLFLNPDAFLNENFFDIAITYMGQNPGSVLLGPRGWNDAGEDAYLVKAYPTLIDLSLRAIKSLCPSISLDRLSIYECHNLAQNIPSKVLFLSGCAMLGRTEALKKLGGFDERYFMFFEDFDLCLRAAREGEIIYHPLLEVTHLGGNTSRKSLRIINHFVKSALIFYKAHGFRLI